jgi:NTP pyrophosphatase (non-canonical NTP hydrolase)
LAIKGGKPGNPAAAVGGGLLKYDAAMSNNDDLTINAFQQHIRDKYYETDHSRGTPGTFMWFVEEVGELATALHGDDRDNLEEEFADVVAWLCTLANINDVDLASAIRAKYLDGDGPAGVKH